MLCEKTYKIVRMKVDETRKLVNGYFFRYVSFDICVCFDELIVCAVIAEAYVFGAYPAKNSRRQLCCFGVSVKDGKIRAVVRAKDVFKCGHNIRGICAYVCDVRHRNELKKRRCVIIGLKMAPIFFIIVFGDRFVCDGCPVWDENEISRCRMERAFVYADLALSLHNVINTVTQRVYVAFVPIAVYLGISAYFKRYACAFQIMIEIFHCVRVFGMWSLCNYILH